MTTSSAAHSGDPAHAPTVSVEALARRKHVRPITSADDLARDGVFETDEELDSFLTHVAATRHSEFA